MTDFRSWLLSVIAAAMALSLINTMMPKGSARTAARTIGGMVMLLVVLQPLLDIRWEEVQWERSYLSEETERLMQEYQAENDEAWKKSIAEETRAYIQDKATSLGLKGEVMVTTKERDSIPYPEEVTLNMPYHGELSRWLTRELEIMPECQHWMGEGG